jgi:hypothetical protein
VPRLPTPSLQRSGRRLAAYPPPPPLLSLSLLDRQAMRIWYGCPAEGEGGGEREKGWGGAT